MTKNLNTSKTNNNISQIIDWKLIQTEMKNKFGSDIYESWLKKIDFKDQINTYVLLSVPTRFIRDWITSRYVDQILQILRSHRKEISRIEFKIEDATNKNNMKTILKTILIKIRTMIKIYHL